MKDIYKVRVVCADAGIFLSDCIRQHIHLFNIKRINDITVEFCVYSDDYVSVCEICNNSNCQYETLKSTGVKSFFSKYLKRKPFFFGIIVVVLVIYYSTGFIYNIEITGNEYMSKYEILSLLKEAGVNDGASNRKLDVKDIQNNVMLTTDKLAWLWIDIKGTNAYVTIKERIIVPEPENKDEYCNYISTSDAVITDIMPRYGKPMVKVGDVVRKGDILISGISETQMGEIRYMHADGVVKGRTWHELDGVYNHTKVNRYLTGNIEKRYSIIIDNSVFPILKENKTSFLEFDHNKIEQKIKFFKKTLPISFTIDTYCEIIEECVEISDDEVVQTAVSVLGKSLYEDICKKRDDIIIIDKTYKYSHLDNGNLYVKVIYECSENIGEKYPLEQPKEISETEEQ